VKSGIDAELLVSQVKSTASWLWEDPRAGRVAEALVPCAREERGLSYFRLLLAAHFATVATFVPTDVDARIRHHAWVAMEGAPEVAAACAVVDEVARWDAVWVSARTVEADAPSCSSKPCPPPNACDRSLPLARALPLPVRDGAARVSGHDGEWLAVRAGALGRAAVLGAADLVDRLVADLDAELEREGRALDQAFAMESPVDRVLSLATILAHNLGDLSRVVEAWPRHPELAAIRTRYARLGHPEAQGSRSSFVRAGILNKALMAPENHRFLPLRKARALRASRAHLLPIGPWFDAWGEHVARSFEEREAAEVATALLELHVSSPDQQGCLRALAGMHRATRGGIEALVHLLPARLRKEAVRGRVREALDVTEDHFRARIERRYRREREQMDLLAASTSRSM
jgi:hypothetical protein